ncbi:thiamine-phosphate kinase [Helicobacter sp. MIT 05-5294]|uniref:thiamine-phosphate kinase n=1 Tax=Helicobacter sp. MIT 05-5294 TaxID=1548150 RepID=UPI00051FE15B|nr:thiamine-phosphate kinase [Helicobacter sp. MIT 05-5294]TLD86728.1 thiamine-phosphate kinase [Helicobacter sp. MIT 05-5294]
MRDREKAFISALKQSGATFGIGDDGVLLDSYVIANDAFFEEVHFKLAWADLESLVEKCFLVNLSDIYAMNAIPRFALLSLCIPACFQEVTRLAQIIGESAKKHQLQIIGGDTLVGEKLHFSLTLLGQERRKTLYRSGIKRGNLLGYISPKGALNHAKAQSFGRNLQTLKTCLRFYANKRIPKFSRFAKPLLYPDMLFSLNQIAKAGMDISDGIFMELSRLSAINRLGFRIFKPKGAWFFSPEEYQMLYAVDSRNLKKMRNFALKFRHQFVPFAVAIRGKYRAKKQNWHR